jgi:hypothetical protein
VPDTPLGADPFGLDVRGGWRVEGGARHRDEQVEPEYTSRRCSHIDCGFTHEDNRSGEHFECCKCGYTVNADYDASKNVALRCARKRRHRLRSSPKTGSADAPVAVPMNIGTLDGSGFSAAAGDCEPGVQIEAHPQRPSRGLAREWGEVIYS